MVMPECAKCGATVYVPDGMEFEKGDLCGTCLEKFVTRLEDGQALYKQASTSPETQEQIEHRKKGIEWLGGLLAGLHVTPDYAMEILMREQKALAELVPVRWKQ
jgi:hypothetical protein